MFEFIKKTAIASWIAINFKNIVNLAVCLVVIFIVGFMHLRWEVYLLETHPEKLLILLVVNSVIFFLILIWMFMLVKSCLNPLNLNKAIDAKKSILKKPEKFEDILSVKLRPKLKRKEK